jgi:hypothetical protein
MVAIDKRLNPGEMDILRQLIGRKIVSLRHNKFCPVHLHAATGVVGIETEQGMIYLYSETDSMNYFGSVEDEAVLTLSHERHAWLDYDECSNALATASPVHEAVKEIHVVQDHQQLYETGEQTFDIWLTWGIIFDFGDYQYSLEKSQGFSGLIFIEKGKDLIHTFSGTDAFENPELWTDDCIAKCDREIVVINESSLL